MIGDLSIYFLSDTFMELRKDVFTMYHLRIYFSFFIIIIIASC